MSGIRRHQLWTMEDWDDGYIRDGRMKVYRPDYPRCHRKSGYSNRSHVVWWLITGHVVPLDMHLHHINGDKLDDHFSNLRLMTQHDHLVLHKTQEPHFTTCLYCGKEFKIYPYEIGKTKYCGRECKDKASVGQKRHKKSKPLVALNCKLCGQEFYVVDCRKDKAIFCSQSCAAKMRGLNTKGKSRPAPTLETLKKRSDGLKRAHAEGKFKKSMIRLTCQWCGEEFYTVYKRSRYCSKKCSWTSFNHKYGRSKKQL